MVRHDDRNRRRGALDRLGRRSSRSDDHVDLEPDQLIREGGKPVETVSVISALEDDVLALDVSAVPQLLEECGPNVPGLRAGRRRTCENAPFPAGGCAPAASGAARSESAEECAPIHHSIT